MAKVRLNTIPLINEIENYRQTTFNENTSKRILNTWFNKYEKTFHHSGYECLDTFMETSPQAENLVRQISMDMDKKREFYLI